MAPSIVTIPPPPARIFSGVNLSAKADKIADHELAWSMNVYPREKGELSLRGTTRWIGSVNCFPDSTAALYQYDDGVTNRVIVWYRSPQTYNTAIFWYDPSVPPDTLGGSLAPVTIYSAVDRDSFERPSAVQWQNSLYLFTGGTEIGYRLTYQDASVPGNTPVRADPISRIWSGSDMPRPTVAFLYRGSIAIAGFANDRRGLLRWLETGDPTQVLSEAKGIYVGRGEGSRIVAGIEVSVEGGADYAESYALVLKERSTYIISGDPPTSTSDGTLKVVRVSKREGCVSKETIAETPSGVVWCSGSNVWIAVAGAGQKPVSIGNAIREYIKKLPRNSDLWTAAYHDGFYRLVVPSAVTNSDGLTTTEQWWCDLREFPERVSWWGPMTMQADALLSVTTSDGVGRLIGAVIKHGSNFLSSKLLLEEYEVPGGADHADNPDLAEEYSANAEIWFKAFDFGDSAVKKIIQGVEVTAKIGSDVLLRVELNGDDGGEFKSQEVSGVDEGFVLDLSRLDDTRLSDEFRTYVFHPPEGSRYIAKIVQPILAAASEDGRLNSFRLREVSMRVRVISRRAVMRTTYNAGT